MCLDVLWFLLTQFIAGKIWWNLIYFFDQILPSNNDFWQREYDVKAVPVAGRMGILEKGGV